ncbi:MAG: hypothetical protein R6U66_10285, partial [Bacteroidales bacterium]
MIAKRTNYVLLHLSTHISDKSFDNIRHQISYITDTFEVDTRKHKVNIFSSEKNEPEINFRINNTPILFPGDPDKPFYTFEQGTLTFHHDLLKSAFYLLSGYQELLPGKLDRHKRFPWERSIQKKLGITKRALVNEYFEIILQGLEQYCQYHNLPFERKSRFATFGLWLSHDVDQVDKYTLNEWIFQAKNVLGLTNSKFARTKRWKSFTEHTFHTLLTRKNPYWNFDFLLETEKKYNLQATYFFLPKRKRHHDAYYGFSEKRIAQLMQQINQAGGEIGLHGTVDSSIHQELLNADLDALSKVSPQTISGIRQHRLMYQLPVTPSLHQHAGLRYDASLGFAEHEGFRNSYCHPFKLYNFEKEEPYEVWQFP